MVRWISGTAMLCAGFGLSGGAMAESTDDHNRREKAGVQERGDIVVTGERPSYVEGESTTATRTATPLRDVPQSIQVIPRSVIEDQNSIRLTDVLQNVSGVQPATTAGNRGEIYQIRGFTTPRYAIDGVLLNRVADRSETFLDLANVETVEVLKGPASVMYGQGDPGGVINITTRRPTDRPTAEISLQAGSFDFARVSATASGPVGDRLAVRVTGAAQTLEGFRGKHAATSTRQFAGFAARWRPGDATTINLDIDHSSQRNPFDRGLVVGADNRVTLPARRFLSEPWSVTGARKTRVVLDVAHRATDWLSLHLNGRYTDAVVQDNYAIDYRALAANGRTLSRRATNRSEDLETVDTRAEAVATFATGGVGHVVLAGGSYSHATLDFLTYRGNIASIDILNPVYNAPLPRLSLNADTYRRSDLYAAYVQDQVTVTDWLKLLGSVRHDIVRDRLLNQVNGREDRRDSSATTWRGGVVVQPVPAISLFGGYGQSFQPQTSQRRDLSYLDPERGRQYEAGVKLDPMGGRLIVTFAAFDITKRNVATPDPADTSFAIQTGEQRVRGLEMDVIGHLTKRWQVIASGSHLDATISRDELFTVGNRLTNVPRWSGRLWSSYLLGGVAEGLTLAGGVTLVGRRAGDLSNSFSVDGYTVYDATISYAVPRTGLELSLTARNLTDAYYIESTVTRLENYPGTPRSILGAVRARF